MAHIVEFSVAGYRAISAPITLKGLGTYVPLYGDNAAGKSSVLLALALLGKLCATPPAELLGSGQPWPSDAFFERFGQDPWMFNAQGDALIKLSATTNVGLTVSFTLTRAQEGILVNCTGASLDGEDLEAALSSARASRAEAQAQSLRDLGDEQVRSALEEAEIRLTAAQERLSNAWSSLTVALGKVPAVPVSDAHRTDLFDAMSSSNAALRAATRSALHSFRELFPALGDGELDVLNNPPLHPKDLAWINSSLVVPLDHLGGGVQSAVATLASLLLTRAAIICLDESEAFVGAYALEGLARIFREAAHRRICEQVWLATHAMALVDAKEPIVVLTRSGGVVSAQQGSADQLGGRFAQALPQQAIAGPRRLGHDGSVRIPPAIIERKGMRTGDFIYFMDDASGVHLLTAQEMAATLPPSDES